MQYVVSNRLVASRLGRCEVHMIQTFLNKWRDLWLMVLGRARVLVWSPPPRMGEKYYRILRLWRIIIIMQVKKKKQDIWRAGMCIETVPGITWWIWHLRCWDGTYQECGWPLQQPIYDKQYTLNLYCHFFTAQSSLLFPTIFGMWFNSVYEQESPPPRKIWIRLKAMTAMNLNQSYTINESTSF